MSRQAPTDPRVPVKGRSQLESANRFVLPPGGVEGTGKLAQCAGLLFRKRTPLLRHAAVKWPYGVARHIQKLVLRRYSPDS